MFWNYVKPFMTNKNTIVNENIIIKTEVDEGVIVKGTNKNFLIKTEVLVDQHHVNKMENSSGKAPNCLEKFVDKSTHM